MRKLASIRKITALSPIEGADAIELAKVDGWNVVVKKNEFSLGDLVVYFELDSWIPLEIAPFLSKAKEPREFEGVKGERLRTIRLRGQISQGLIISPKELNLTEYNEDEDLTELLGIKKWEPPINKNLATNPKGNFPIEIPKTDQERVQNLKKLPVGETFEVTEKLEGSSMTVYLLRGEFGVCSRNLDLKMDENSSFWHVALRDNIEQKMREFFGDKNVAIQGELIGPSIQGNIYKLTDYKFMVYDIYSVYDGCYLKSHDRLSIVNSLGLEHVPILEHSMTLDTTIDDLLKLADGDSALYKTSREGIVFKSLTSRTTFKVISNEYLVKQK